MAERAVLVVFFVKTNLQPHIHCPYIYKKISYFLHNQFLSILSTGWRRLHNDLFTERPTKMPQSAK